MTRLLVLGAAPLPHEPQRRQYAANLRTWHFTQPLLADGHDVRLLACRLPETYPPGLPPESRNVDGAFEYFSLDGPLFEDEAYLQRLCDEFDPEAIVGVNSYPSSRAVRLYTEAPIWCDMNGWVPAEAQTKAYVYDDDVYLSHFWRIEQAVVDRADVISTVSDPQAYATLGELAARGRLSKATFGYAFVHRIPNAVTEVELRHEREVFRGHLVPENAFVVLWLGGYNTWTDVTLLYDALSAAMADLPDLHFVSTGGAIEGHDDITFRQFRQRIDAGPFAERFHFVGWVPTEDVPSYYFESDLGLNVDSDNYETTFGARNRLNEMAKAGLPVLTTLGTEISHIFANEGLGLSSPLGDAAGFAEQIRWAARHPEELRAMAERARGFVIEEFSYGRTTEPLRRWAQKPERAPDLGRRAALDVDVDFFRPEPAADAAPDPTPTPKAETTPQPTEIPLGGPYHARDYFPRVLHPLLVSAKSLIRGLFGGRQAAAPSSASSEGSEQGSS